jgi:predicted nuclease of predicted toxin-antitoxin system
MKLLLDMGASPRTAEYLRGKGHDAVHLRELGLHRLSDEGVIQRAAAEGRVVVTFDLDFPRILALQRRTGPSIIVFRLGDVNTDQVNWLMGNVLNRYEQQLAKGALVMVEPNRLRIRMLPIQ